MTKGYTVHSLSAFKFNLAPNQLVRLTKMKNVVVFPKRNVIRDDHRPCVPAIIELANECNVEIRHRSELDYRSSGIHYYEAVGTADDVMIFALRWNSDWGTRV